GSSSPGRPGAVAAPRRPRSPCPNVMAAPRCDSSRERVQGSGLPRCRFPNPEAVAMRRLARPPTSVFLLLREALRAHPPRTRLACALALALLVLGAGCASNGGGGQPDPGSPPATGNAPAAD